LQAKIEEGGAACLLAFQGSVATLNALRQMSGIRYHGQKLSIEESSGIDSEGNVEMGGTAAASGNGQGKESGN
jgi:hypothetical protein